MVKTLKEPLIPLINGVLLGEIVRIVDGRFGCCAELAVPGLNRPVRGEGHGYTVPAGLGERVLRVLPLGPFQTLEPCLVGGGARENVQPGLSVKDLCFQLCHCFDFTLGVVLLIPVAFQSPIFQYQFW